MLCEQTAALFLFWAEGLPYLLSLHKEACQSFSFSNIDDQNCKRAPAFHCLNCKYLMDTINWCLIVTCVQVVYNQVQHSICWKLIFQQKHFPLVPEYYLVFCIFTWFPTQGLKLTQFPVMSHFSAVLLAVPRFVTSRLHWHIPKVCAKPPSEVNKQDLFFFFFENKMSHPATNLLPSTCDFHFSAPYCCLPINQLLTHLVISVCNLIAFNTPLLLGF